MTQSPSADESDDRATPALAREPKPATPRWVKVLGIVALVAVVLLVVLLLVGGGDHGPGRHTGDNTESGAVAGHSFAEGAHA